MAKYSTGRSSGGGSEGSCELCGRESESLSEASIAGAVLSVCDNCAPHDDRGPKNQEDGGQRDEGERRRRAAQQTAQLADSGKGDPTYWIEEGTNYESDPLPYLVSGYGETVESARQAAGLTIEELADEIDSRVSEIEAVEQGRAARAGVGGSVVTALEEALDVSITEEA